MGIGTLVAAFVVSFPILALLAMLNPGDIFITTPLLDRLALSLLTAILLSGIIMYGWLLSLDWRGRERRKRA